ncbi:MAG: hypothetical protein P9L92_01190 [Candidatus Electryonea clarkiae]|nr:hypothetical protein [Candidatus Electryonea clarkiae]MDP8286636.1 hypothetical protein [Candidatus Electryonea clarkiae]
MCAKAIVSHDVDHLTIWEHYKDLIVPKYMARNCIQLFSGSISLSEWTDLMGDILSNEWNNIEEVMKFDKEHGVPSTFFIGVSNGLGLSYSLASARKWVNRILANGFDVGVHGIAFDDLATIQKEFQTFKSISGLQSFGIRMHYLRMNSNTLEYLDQTGYLFDSTIDELSYHRKLKNMYVFPLHIMDCNILYKGIAKSVCFSDAWNNTKAMINQIIDMDIAYLTINFHDRYFRRSHMEWKEWYIQLIEYLIDNGVKFMNYRDAIFELDQK